MTNALFLTLDTYLLIYLFIIIFSLLVLFLLSDLSLFYSSKLKPPQVQVVLFVSDVA